MIGARARYADVEDFVRFIEERGGVPLNADRWDPWVFDHHHSSLRHQHVGVSVSLWDCLGPRASLTALQRVATSRWSTDRDVHNLSLALDDLLLQPRIEVDAAALPTLIEQAAGRCTTRPWRTQR